MDSRHLAPPQSGAGYMALLLAGGLATRLGPLRNRWAKACFPIGGVSPLAFLLPRLFTAGYSQVWINVHHQAEQVKEEAKRVAPPQMQVEFLEENTLLGTGGTFMAVAEQAQRFPDLVVNAKLFTDFDFAATLQEPPAWVALHPLSALSEFGGLRFNQQRYVTGLRTKGKPNQEAGAAVFTGISRPSESWLDHLYQAKRKRPEETLCLVRDGLIPSVEAGQPTRVLMHSGYWYEISTPERIQEVDRVLRLGPMQTPTLN